MDCICSKHAVQAIQRQANASTIFLVDTLKRQFLYKNTINFDVDIFFPRLFVVEPVSRVFCLSRGLTVVNVSKNLNYTLYLCKYICLFLRVFQLQIGVKKINKIKLQKTICKTKKGAQSFYDSRNFLRNKTKLQSFL